MSVQAPRGGSMLVVAVGNLLVVLSLLTERPLSTVLGAAALLVLAPQAFLFTRAWLQARTVDR